MSLQFTHPLYLLVLVALAVHVAWMGRRLAVLSKPRRWTALALRLLVLTCLIGALAGARWARQSKLLTVLYVQDQSDSVPLTQREYAQTFVNATLGQMGANDRAGQIVFGGDSAVEQTLDRSEQPKEVQSVVDRSRTDIADAIELAMACFVGQSQKRIVLLSDGNQNAGNALEAARAAAAAKVSIDVVPLTYDNRNDAIVDKVVVENRVNLDEPFDLKILANARTATSGKMRVYQDSRLVGQFYVTLNPDQKNVFVMTTQVRDAGFHTFEAQLDVPGDAIAENNRAFGFTYGAGEPRVLLVDGDARPSQALPAMLRSEKIDVQWTGPDGLPATLRELQSYDALIFNNVGAGDISDEQMKMIEHAVHELGMGFIMIGGENSFGSGGYNDSPIEQVLPVEMELKNEKILPKGALVPIIHTVEIPDGQYWAEQIVHAALNALSPRDLMGVLYYGYPQGESWLFPLQEVGNKSYLHGLIDSIQPGDMPSFDRTLEMAHVALSQSTASVKHIVIISDGDPATPNQALAKEIQVDKISISTVCINPHSPRDVDVMKDLARLGGGNFYQVTSFNTLPQIFIKEAATVRKSLIFEDPFTPVIKQTSPVTAGLGEGYPTLGGYIGTSIKPLADMALATQNDDPLLAHWRYGVGKSLAFTSDAKERWAAQWTGWNGYAKFWAQAVRWVLRTPFNPNYQVQMEIDGTRGKITVDAVDAKGDFQNFLQMQGSVITPTMEAKPVELRQVAPGRYEGSFEASEPGTYMLGAQAATADGEGADLLTGGASLAFSPEFEQSHSNDTLLKQIAMLTGGRVLDQASPVFEHNLTARAEPTPLWPLLLAIMMPLFLADVFVRRVLVGWGDITEATAFSWRWTWDRLLPRRRQRAEATGQLLEVKQKIRKHGQQSAEEQREAFLATLAQVKADRPSALAQAEPRPTIAPKASKPAATKPPAGPQETVNTTSELLKARSQTRGKMNKSKREDEGS